MGLTVYVCLDDRNGMSFNGRRQSRDSKIFEDIRQELPGELLIDPFSEKLIERAGLPYRLMEGPLPEEGNFFLEMRPAQEALAADRIVIYRWGRHYPADRRWDLGLEAQGYSLAEQKAFLGTSHELIGKDVYRR